VFNLHIIDFDNGAKKLLKKYYFYFSLYVNSHRFSIVLIISNNYPAYAIQN